MNPIKLPEDYSSLGEIRAEIDRIDRSIVQAIGERRRYVIAAAKFKRSAGDVSAPDRLAAMLKARRHWAGQEGVDPDVVEKLYRELVSHFIAEERAHWEAGQRGV